MGWESFGVVGPGDYNLHHVCAYVRPCVGHAFFSETTTDTHFW